MNTLDTVTYPKVPMPCYENIPGQLKALRQWVVWRLETRPSESKPTKVPYQPNGNGKAKAGDLSTWGTFTEAVTAYQNSQSGQHPYSGIGFELADDDGLFGGDLDGCIDADTGEVAAWASEIVALAGTYTERSPSGTGLRFFGYGSLPDGRRKHGQRELYERVRYLTITGRTFGEARPVTDCSGRMAALHALMFPVQEQKAQTSSPVPLSLSDTEIIDKATSAANGAKFSALWNGDTSAYNGDDSAADLALCRLLAFWTGPDEGRIASLFSLSGLYRPKWDRPDYQQRTISAALSGVNVFYSPVGAQGIRASVSHAEEPLQSSEPLWPTAEPEMFHGLAGDIVRVIEPHTEADPVALLVQLITAFGSAIGRSAHFTAEADQHFGNLFVVLVGISAKGRKGISWGHIKRLFALAAPQWERFCLQSGLSSGEGLIWHVRDAVEKPVKNKQTGSTELEIVDPGIGDKRLLVMEAEFASVLRVAGRDGNTLSAILRGAWDQGRLQTMTKNSAASATGAHISAIGHVTADELRRELSSTEAGNGFANRFLWICAKRSKELPEGGDLQEAELCPLAGRLEAAIEAGRQGGHMVRDDEARVVWHAVYHDLSEADPGLAGAVTSRAEAQVMRLALLYAVLDQSDCIRREHLTAALALWEYVEASARYVFGDSMGDPVADDILLALRRNPEGMSRNDLRELFQRHQSSNRIGQALALLAKHKRAKVTMQKGTGGRPAEVWKAAENS